MEKFNPNKKKWEPLFGDTTIKKYAPAAPKDLEKPEIPELPKSIVGHLNETLEKMTTFEEKEDEFILEHLARWYGSVTSLTGVTRIPKRLIIRSIECFKREHREEFEAIMKGDK